MILNYEFTIWTSYIEQMNQIVEKINYSDGAYWGEPGKMRFRTRIESFSDASEIEGERLIKTTFSVNISSDLAATLSFIGLEKFMAWGRKARD